MIGNRFIINTFVVLGMVVLCTGCLPKKEISTPVKEVETKSVDKVAVAPVSTVKPVVKNVDLYSQTPYDMPLMSVVEISKLPPVAKKTIDKVLESSQGFYLLKTEKDKVHIILQNPIDNSNTYCRHGLQFAEVSMDGSVKYSKVGYAGVDGEISEALEPKVDDWVFEEAIEPKRPLKHIAYDEHGGVKFTEFWNYDEKNPVRYQMKDSDDKIVSILKESLDNDSNFRKEHVFYDQDGKTTMSLTVNYDGANISRMTYYNVHDSVDSMSILSEYADGVKTKELIYNEDYELVNTVTSEYTDGERKDIRVLDSGGNEIENISN